MKKQWKKGKKLAMVLLLALTFLFCSIPGQTVKAATPKMKYKTLTLIKGEKKKLKVKNASGKKRWSSSKKSVATVSSSGVVRAKKKGTAVISCKVGRKTVKCRLKVETPSISARSLKLKVGTSKTLVIKNTSLKKKWSSSNKAVATVNSRGKVTAKREGKAVISCKISSKVYKCTVTVTKAGGTATPTPEPTNPDPTTPKPPVLTPRLSSTSLAMLVGAGNTLTVSNYSAYCFWSSDNNAVVEVKSTGNTSASLTAHREGTATITCEAGKTVLTCTVTVSKKIDTMQEAVVVKSGTHNETYMGEDNNPVTKAVDEYTVTFTTLPDNLEELKQFKLDSQYKTMALYIMVMRTWTLDSQTEYTKMMNYLTNHDKYPSYGIPGEQKTKSALAYPSTTGGTPLYKYLGNSYLNGASVANNYTPGTPFSVTLYDNVKGPVAATATTPLYYPIWVKCAGADTPRYTWIYHHSDGNWYMWANSWSFLLLDIKPPACDNPF